MENKVYDADYKQEETPPLLKWIEPGSRVLEFGTATGYMTRYMKEKLNCSVVGIEISREMAARAAAWTEKMIVANVDTDPWTEEIEGTFDVVLFGDVLEHLRNPQEVLIKAKSFLSPGGHILTSVPNIAHNAVIMSLMDGEFNYTPYGLLDDTHIHFFTRQSLFEMAGKAGLVCMDENNCKEHPAMTEIGKSYLGHFLRFLLLIRRKDAHVYQYRTKWGIKGNEPAYNYVAKPQRLSTPQVVLAWADDANLWIENKFHFSLKLPAFIKKRVRK